MARRIDPWHLRLAGVLIAWGVRLLSATVRLTRIRREPVQRLMDAGEQVIYAFWHGRQFVMLGAHEGEGVVIMVSLSRDGTLQKAVIEHHGYTPARGSSSRRGREALGEMEQRMVGEGLHAALAVDGPRGPREEAKPGAVALAGRTGAWLVPLSAAVKRGWRLNTWDGTWIPLPFSRAWLVYGEPLRVGADPGERGEARATLQRRLDTITAEAESLSGRVR